ncbi:MAG: hypothetical protein WC391_02395 [Methanoregula sp.]|jgi:hypothetical protein
MAGNEEPPLDSVATDRFGQKKYGEIKGPWPGRYRDFCRFSDGM